ncbi:MAG: amidohydrolase family protein [Clostridia bacterium]|nr:amidohydrolase family protein [Clostridia bacterium]
MSCLFISGGWVIDPEKKRSFPADVLVSGGAIAGFYPPCGPCPEGAQRLDARGCFVCPGFIDPHGHIDGDERTGMLSLLQGITTSVGGNCGFSPVDVGAFLSAQKPFPIHQAELVGMCALREAAGLYDLHAAANEEQICIMQSLCECALTDGAAGVSLGPSYTPGASMEEMAALCSAAKRFNRPVAIDTRMHSMTDLHSLQEAIQLAEETGCRMVISHFVYQYGVGVEDEALAMMDAARARGVDMQLDSGMYTHWCSSVGSALFEEETMEENDIELRHLRVITGEHIGQSPDRALLDHLRKEHPEDAVVVMTGEPEAVYTIQRFPLTMVSTDTGSYAPGEGHPQIAGSFPRYFRKMVREHRGLTWEEAVRHTTLIPAQVFGLEKKGRMAVGMDADIVVFEPDHLTDTAKFPGLGQPDAAPEGVRYVIVAGEVAAQYGKPTGIMAGRAWAAGAV